MSSWVELPFPSLFLYKTLFFLDLGDPTLPFISASSWSPISSTSLESVGLGGATSLLAGNIPEVVGRDDFSWMANVGTWSDWTYSSGLSTSSSIRSPLESV